MAVIYKVPLSNNSQYTLDTQYTAGGTSLVLNTNVASVVQAPGTCVVDRVDSSGNKTASKRTYYTFTGVSTTTLTGLAVADGTDQAHAVGAIVEFVPDITWAQAMYNGLTAVVDPTTQALDTTKVVDLTTAQTISKKTIKSSLSEVVTTAGGTTSYTLTPSVAIAAYATGQEFVIKMNATNTGASTINVSGLGAKSLTKSGATALSSGDLAIDGIYTITYDGTQFQVSGGAGSGGSNSFIIGETPSGTVNGSNAAFDTASNYVAGSIQVYRDGQRMVGGGADYTETDSNTITFTTAPVTGSVIKVDYQTSTGTSGNADTVDTYHAAITPAASTVAVHNSSGVLFSPIYAPQGFLQNGKISVTDAAGITVAIKTLAGADPSASDPVYVRIGDTVRSITAALSVAKADGTNWFNSGGAELATNEADYFVYLGYNVTDGVVIGFSRIPYASQYSDFSATTTNDKYCAISTITTAASTDYYQLVGRFAATLSAGAGYTWTVPTFTAINLKQYPIYETRLLVWSPTISGGTGATYTIPRYKIIFDRAWVSCAEIALTASNANTKTFVAPISSGATLPGTYLSALCTVKDNGAQQSTPGHLTISTGSTATSIYKSWYQGAWTTSGAWSAYVTDFTYPI